MSKLKTVFLKSLSRRITLNHLMVVLFVLFFSSISQAQEIIVSDGDTFRIDGVKIRIWGIDAPELNQTCQAEGHELFCGEDSRFLLQSLIGGNEVRCDIKDTDRFGRSVAQCFANDTDLASEMILQGYALDYPKYSNGFYSKQQQEAQRKRRGVWKTKFIEPWKWRHDHKK